MASKRMMNCSVCVEAKSKLTMIDGNLCCTQCIEEMKKKDIKSEPQYEDDDDVKIEDENGFDYAQQTDSLGEHEFTVVIKDETKFDEEADMFKDTVLLLESDTEDLQAEIDIKEETTIEKIQFNNEDEEDVAPSLFKCPECPSVYTKRFRLNEHIQKKHEQEAISCEICGNEFEWRHSYLYHKKTIHTEPQYSCPHCQKKFHFSGVYKRHILTHRNEKNQNTSQGSSTFRCAVGQPGIGKSKQGLRCTYCGLHFVSNPDLRAHLRESHPEDRKVTCSICFFYCQGDTLYREHIREKHGGFECMCKICLELYHSGTYEDHKKQCQGRLVFQCNLCQECYGKNESLWKHLDEHAILEETKGQSTTVCRIKEQFLTCKICEDDKLYERAFYQKHIKNVHQGYYIRCPKCRQIFKSSATRSRHTCTGATNSKANIQVNSVPKRRFTKRPIVVEEFKCPECPRVYGKAFRLNEHIKLSHRSGTCEVCGVKFETMKRYRYHKAKCHKKTGV